MLSNEKFVTKVKGDDLSFAIAKINLYYLMFNCYNLVGHQIKK